MKYFLDTADIEELKRWKGIVDGVTSNPHLLRKAKIDVKEFIQDMVNTTINTKIFVQVGDFDQAKELQKYWHDCLREKYIPFEEIKNMSHLLVFKVSMHPDMYSLIKKLKKQNWTVAATTVYDIVQINQAIELECDYTMVYKHKNENSNLFSEAYQLKQISKSNIQLVGASFRGKQEVQDAILSGMDYATVRPEHLKQVFKNGQLQADFDELYA